MNTLLNRYNTIIWIRLFGELLTSLTNSMIAPFLILYLHQKLGGSVMLPLMIVGLQPFTDIVVTLFAGGITDRIGRKPILLFALFLQMCAMTGFIFADSIWMFASVYIVNGIGRSLYIPAQRAQIADAVSEEHRSEVFALLSTMGYISMSIGPLLGVIMFRYNPIILFILQALALLLYLIVIWLKVPETIPIIRKQVKQAEKEMKKQKTFLTALFLEYKYVLGLMICTLPISLFYAQVEMVFPLHLKATSADYLSIISGLAATKAIVAVLLQVWLVKKTEKWSMYKIIITSYFCFVIAAIGYGYTKTFFLLLLVQFVFTIGESIGLTHLLKFVSVLAPVNQRGRYFSLFGIHWDISRTTGPALGGLVFENFGGKMLFSISAILLVFGIIAQYHVIRIIHRTNTLYNKTFEHKGI